MMHHFSANDDFGIFQSHFKGVKDMRIMTKLATRQDFRKECSDIINDIVQNGVRHASRMFGFEITKAFKPAIRKDSVTAAVKILEYYYDFDFKNN